MPNSVALIAKGLESRESGEAKALGYLQRLNVAGMDVKGQISSAYAESGFGLGIDAKFDFGALFVPFVHLDVGLSMAGARTAHALLLLQRMPKTVWLQDHVRPPQPPEREALTKSAPVPPNPTWQTQRPVAMAFLKGRTLKMDAKLTAAAWAGVGSFDGFDETGLTIGLKAVARSGGSITRLVDVQPRHYPPSPSDSTLADDVDDLFDERLKAKVAAWITACVEGVEKLRSYDVPAVSLRERAIDDGLKEDAQSALLTTLDYYDKLTINDVDSKAVAGLGVDVVKVMVAAVKKVKAMVLSKQLTTDGLLAELRAIEPTLLALVEQFKHKKGNQLLPSDVRYTLWDAAVQRHKEVGELIAALERHKARKARRSVPASPPPAATASPPFHLDIAVGEGSINVGAGTKFVLPRNLVAAKLAFEATCQFRSIAFRYQATVPGSGRRTLLCSQDTALRYTTRKATATGAATAAGTAATGFLNERSNLVTMSYRSVHVQWFDDLLSNHHQALPNGSGVSFGMSVLAEMLDAYRRACGFSATTTKPGAPPPPSVPPPAFDLATFKDLESAMTKQLCVEPDALRAFMRGMPDWIGETALDVEEKARVESFIVESSFAFKTPQKLTIVKNRPDKLFELAPVKRFISTGKCPDELRLQALRLRFRVRTDDDKSRSLISLGWNPEPWGEGLKPWGEGKVDGELPWYVRLTGVNPKLPDWLKVPALALELGIGIERVQRVGTEGIVELHQTVFPAPYDRANPPKGYGLDVAKELENKNLRRNAELLVPPVVLFSQ